MSGQTCAWRSLYSVSRSGLTWSWKHTRTSGSPQFSWSLLESLGARSEVEVVDVVGVELERVAEQHRAVRADRERAQVTGVEGVALLAGDVAVDQGLGGVRREGAEVGRVPERELGDGAVLDVVAHLVRRAEPGQHDLALGVGGGEVAGSGRDADGGRRDDALEVGVRREQ